ncbi:hypothetical protein SADO_08207 [Salinisphaera dokdonensis CL-ES53]|uniref:DUF4145 domain-containing protein n=1 Tax=Salinisphaera dokdonensis CL-ES53 TaxID=1304272 RepID=A0ABV2B015_9GAMM
MSREFWRATAEAVVAAVDAAYIAAKPVDQIYVSEFCQLTRENAYAALKLAVDLDLLREENGEYVTANCLCRALVTSNQQRKATALRLALEDYEPFILFRDRLITTGDAPTAARQLKQLLDLSNHFDEIKETLLSLGQYCRALIAEGGGAYRAAEEGAAHDLQSLAGACSDLHQAESLVCREIGADFVPNIPRAEVIQHLADALLRARDHDGIGAVTMAGNAIESYLGAYGEKQAVSLVGKHGINAKAEELSRNAKLPKKLLNYSKYLGHLRNAADHGVDDDVQATWDISPQVAVEYVFVACSFIRSSSQFVENSNTII